MKITRLRSGVDAVCFDLGRVLVDFDWMRALGEVMSASGLTREQIKERLILSEAFRSFETGRRTPREFHADVERQLSMRMPYERFCELWNSIFTDEISEIVALAERLRSAGMRVAVLSNTNVLHAEYLRQRYAWLRTWDHVYLSHEIGARKPDAASYCWVLERTGVAADKTVFVDDLPDNIDGARAVGMRGVLAHSPQAALEGLAELGIT